MDRAFDLLKLLKNRSILSFQAAFLGLHYYIFGLTKFYCSKVVHDEMKTEFAKKKNPKVLTLHYTVLVSQQSAKTNTHIARQQCNFLFFFFYIFFCCAFALLCVSLSLHVILSTRGERIHISHTEKRKKIEKINEEKEKNEKSKIEKSEKNTQNRVRNQKKK